ncbi:MAG: glycosyltransferase [Acidimicrobiia bacterium]|nr:glycosyltransferase [Acidimicrobiia bacterium]
MTLNSTDVSVVMAVRDGERYLAEALESVLGQTARPGEVVVVDDGSTDSTLTVLASFGNAIRVVSQPPMGQAAAMNRGIEESTGELLAFLDSDDVWMLDALTCRLQRLHESDRPDGVFGSVAQFVSPGIPEHERRFFRFDPEPRPVPLPGTLLVHRAAFASVGKYDEGLRTGANLDWVSRARIAGMQLVSVPDVVLRRRLHDLNLGITMRGGARQDLLAVVRAHRARQATEPDDSGSEPS